MNRLMLQFISTVILLIVVQSTIFSCPYCNQQFYNELLGKRANTLGGQELLEAIRNQTAAGQPSNFVLPSSTNSLTDIQQLDNQSTSVIAETNNPDESQPKTASEYLPYAVMIAQMIFFSQLIA